MFDWFWEFLYLISKTLFRLIDGLVQCANYLCGITPVKVNGEDMDILQYIFTSDTVRFAFSVAVLLSMIIVVVFSIIAILRTLAKDKAEGTPAQIVGKAIKSVLSFMFIPLIMIVVVNAGNVFMNAMYQATMQGGNSLGDFLFKSFAIESGASETAIDEFLANPDLDWRVTAHVWTIMDLSNFEFIFSYIAGIVILGAVGVCMMYFVSRIIHITILYIAAPFSIGASILDDGARFKLWREQMLVKFITGYGMMLAVNIYAMVCSLVMNPTLVFFEKGSFIDYLLKLLLIAGGGVSLKQAMALIGNLISNGAGSNELRDTAISGGLGGMMMKVPGMGIAAGIGASLKQEVTGKAAQKILPSWAQRSYGGGRGAAAAAGGGGGSNGGDEGGSDSHNGNSPMLGSGGNAVKNAINGTNDNKGGNNGGGGNDNKGNLSPQERGNSLVNSIINNGGNNGAKKGDYDDLYED